MSRSRAMKDLSFRFADGGDLELVTGLLARLFPDTDPEQLRQENRGIIGSENEILLLAFVKESPAGIAHLALRCEYVEGSSPGQVCACLEAIYVLPACRLKGIARLLVLEGERWAKGRGCTLLASDCELDNRDSECFHKSLGFEEVSRNIHFIKALDEPGP